MADTVEVVSPAAAHLLSPDDQSVKGTRTSAGAGYPLFSLADTAAALKKIGEYGRVHSLTSLAGHLGHTTTNSGPVKQKLASLRYWGVIERQGDDVTLTATGLAIALPTGENETAVLQEAFFNARVFADVYAAVVKNRPLEIDLIGNTAVRNHAVAAKSRDDFTKSFVASAVVAGLAERPDPAHVTLHPKPAMSDDGRVAGTDTRISSIESSGSSRGSNTGGLQPVLRQQWEAGPAHVLLEIRSTRALAAADYQQLGKVIVEIEHLVKAMTPDAGSDAAK